MTHQSQNPDRREEIIRKHFHGFSNEQFTEIKKSFPYSEIPYILSEYASLVTQEKDALLLEKEKEIREWRELVENIKQDHIKVVDELKGKEGEALKKAANHHANLLEYMHCLESVIGFAGPVEEVKKELQAKEERIEELEEDIDRFVWCLEQYYSGEINNYGIQKAEELASKYKNEEGE